MFKTDNVGKNEEGFILIVALFAMLIITILGISTSTNTSIELQISGNDKLIKETFYSAEGGVETGIRILEENINCPGGFTENRTLTDGTKSVLIDGVEVLVKKFWDVLDSDRTKKISTLTRTAVIPPRDLAGHDSDVRTNIYIYQTYSGYGSGQSNPFAEGYKLDGKSSASSSFTMAYRIIAQQVGRNNSESIVEVEWLHIGKKEGDCKY